MIDWQAFLVPAAVLLVIPVAIIPAFSRPNGSIIVSAALGVAAFAILWLAMGGVSGIVGINLITFVTGLLATIVAWALSINAAAQARRWVWVGLLVVTGYLTFLAVFVSIFSIQPCYPEADFTMTCPPENPLRQALIVAGYLACPVAALAFGLLPRKRRVRQPPEGLVVSSLRAAPSPGAGSEKRIEG